MSATLSSIEIEMKMNESVPRNEISRATINVAGVPTSYYEAGRDNSEPIVFLHGMSSSADSFREAMAELSQAYWTIAPDIPGFGYSGDTHPYTFPRLINWLEEFLRESGATPAHIVGHSFGGALAVSYALADPADARTLILLAPSVLRPGKYPQWLRKFAQTDLSERLLALGVSASRLLLQRQMRAAFYDPSQYDSSLWERRARDYERARASAAVLRASALHNIRDDLHEIRQRSCIIWGENDPVLESTDAAILSNLMPQSRTTMRLLPQCGHIPHVEKHAHVMKIIHSFLDSE